MAFLLIGTYTHENKGPAGTSKGILSLGWDGSGLLGKPELWAELESPSFLARHPKLDILYAVSESGDGKVSTLDLKPQTPNLKRVLQSNPSHGDYPCHVSVSPEASKLAVSNYGSGTLAVYGLDSKGLPGAHAQVVQLEGSGPNKSRQEGPHAHSAFWSPDGAWLLLQDLGTDQIHVFEHLGPGEKLKAHESIKLSPGAGPRHLSFHPSGKYFVVINELNNTLTSMEFRNGQAQENQTVCSLPADFKESSSTAEVRFSSDGRFVYGSNRGHDSLVVFEFDAQSGELSHIQHADCGGKSPRNFAFSPDGRHLLCAHQDSDSIQVFARDGDTGVLKAVGSKVVVPKPVCLLFV